jgi:hypothetical protein
LVKASNDRGGRLQDIFLAKDGVCRRDSRLRDNKPVMHIPKIDEAGNLPRLGPRIAHQDIVIVRITIDHAAAQTGQQRSHFGFVEREKFSNQLPPVRIVNLSDVLLDPASAGRIPFQFTDCRSV